MTPEENAAQAFKDLNEAEVKFLHDTGWTRKEGGWTHSKHARIKLLSLFTQDGAVKLQKQIIIKEQLLGGHSG
jgi:hypothetical protein